MSGQIPKFSSNVKLNITGNDLLGHNMSEQPRGENATTHTTVNIWFPIWIVGMFLCPLYISILPLSVVTKYKQKYIKFI